ncbi:putative bifunctional diguanylate cyclase/phosphodiesterase [Pseudokineococcus basanitobsidens]|uniref:putative bifunctional diguanylate cyclase/phosphodiesterase n=1 Tax=Pseudokineococcus basanitobsidens TaxID=1926649 RepID=UPI0030D9E3BB
MCFVVVFFFFFSPPPPTALLVGPAAGARAPVAAAPWWVLVPLFTAAELVVVHVQARRESLSVSFAEIPLVLGLVLATPSELLAASVLGSLVGLLYRRQSGLKLLFNVCLFALEAALAASVYHVLVGGAEVLSARGLGSVLATIVVADLVSAAALTLVVWLRAGELDGDVLREAVTSGLVAALANASVGLLVVLVAATEPLWLVLLVVLMATLVAAYRAHSVLSRGHARLESLYRFTRRVNREVGVTPVATAVLHQARDVLGADEAELVVLGEDRSRGAHLCLGADGQVRTGRPAVLGQWWEPARDGHAVRAQDVHGLAAPLHARDEVAAVLVVSGRPHHLGAFTGEDLRLLESLANHAAVSLDNAQLLDTVREEAAAQEHLSLHDALTGLANRRRALRVLAEQLRHDGQAAVLMLDLEGFTDINNALGHGVGDAVLREVGQRLVAVTGTPDRVARLGNDEFAVVLEPCTDTAAALRRAREVLREVCGSFRHEHLTVDVRVSAGLAAGVQDVDEAGIPVGVDAAVVLQRADTALYLAKHERTDLRVWTPRDAHGANRRMALLVDLRQSLDEGGLEVHYQAKVDPRTREVTGAEALARWEHPHHGRVSPEEFIPLAEQTGLITPLTELVLRTALADCARWRVRRPGFRVAVNISARSVLDPTLPAQVDAALVRALLPASALVLEITETAVMGDLARALPVLRGLRRLGVHLSVDDFGTGQSSLAYLKQLPVDEMKIDRSFVTAMASDTGDATIARAAIDLGHALGLSVVAEGVEDARTVQMLAEWGCDTVQGYHLGRPQTAQAMTAWLAGPTAGAQVPAQARPLTRPLDAPR